VFGPFYRAWAEHGWRAPAPSDPAAVSWQTVRSDELPQEPAAARDLRLPDAGEEAAHAAWDDFRDRLSDYPEDRERPGVEGTSRMSAYLKLGTLHPRTLLADLGHDKGSDTFRRELAWREFYAAVLAAEPQSARDYLHPQLKGMPYATGRNLEKRLRAWERGETGYPIVDAGMRQLLAEGWMHNRVRMIVASFLVKDLHVEWTHGARHFLHYLVDGDLASNQHNWQWVAGCGTDAAPFFRIFNPVTQGRKFDPDGVYVRRWVPELTSVEGRGVHEPWTLAEPPAGYPAPIVDHAEERAASLEAYEALRAR
jgi:deoxyribodipyrimidine photo-lyase